MSEMHFTRRGWHETAEEREERELRQLEALGHQLVDRQVGVVDWLVCERCGQKTMHLSLRESCRGEEDE